MWRPVAPTSPSAAVLALCAELAPTSKPVVLPLVRVARAIKLECFEVVARQVASQGGTPCYGWLIWEWIGVFIEAEFHAVWRDADGRLHDITPKREHVNEILFVPDPALTFEHKRVDNVRRPLSSDPAIREYLRACAEEFALINRGARASLRQITLFGEEARQLLAIRGRKAALELQIGLVRQPAFGS